MNPWSASPTTVRMAEAYRDAYLSQGVQDGETC